MCPAPWNDLPTSSISYSASEAPMCEGCRALEANFFDICCPECRILLESDACTVNHVFAVLRQWVPQVQQQIDKLVAVALDKGAGPDDRDAVTDMTLLMYVCKAGAQGVGSPHKAAQMAELLIGRGADLSVRCKWSDMSALHYATYFDAAKVLSHLLMQTKGRDVDARCSEYENGSALHIAAANLCVDSAQVLVKFGADLGLEDDLIRRPDECLPDEDDLADVQDEDGVDEPLHSLHVLQPETLEKIEQLRKILCVNNENHNNNNFGGNKGVSGRSMMQALNLKVGERVLVQQQTGSSLRTTLMGTLRFCGTTHFAAGVWAGVELDEMLGKNDGSVNDVVYFECENNRGIFVPATKIAPIGKNFRANNGTNNNNSTRKTVVNVGRVDVRHVTPRLTNRLAEIEEQQEVMVGDRVLVVDVNLGHSSAIVVAVDGGRRRRTKAQGVVRFVGQVDFEQDPNAVWYGVELDEPLGRHDGSVRGVRYFSCDSRHGLMVSANKIVKIDAKKAAISSKQVGSINGSNSNLSNGRYSSNGNLKDPNRKERKDNNKREGNNNKLESENSISKSKSKSEGWQTVSMIDQPGRFERKLPRKYLDVGTSAIHIASKELCLVRYVGRVDFSDGIWVGLELRSPLGKHDGVVAGKRYFSARMNHGLMVRPRKIAVHGINGDNLIREEHEYPF